MKKKPTAKPAKPKIPQNVETLHFFTSHYAVIPDDMQASYAALANRIEAMPESFSKAVALRTLLESRDWAARASYVTMPPSTFTIATKGRK